MNVMERAYRSKDCNPFAKRSKLSKIWGEENTLLVVVEGTDDERFFRTKIWGRISIGCNLMMDLDKSYGEVGKKAVIDGLTKLDALKKEAVDNTKLDRYHFIGVVDRDDDNEEYLFKKRECLSHQYNHLYCYDSFDLENTILRSNAFVREANVGDESKKEDKHIQNRDKLIHIAAILTCLWKDNTIKKNWDLSGFQKNIISLLYKNISKKRIDTATFKKLIKKSLRRTVELKKLSRLLDTQVDGDGYVRGKQLLATCNVYFGGNDFHSIEEVKILDTLIQNYDFGRSKLYEALGSLKYVELK